MREAKQLTIQIYNTESGKKPFQDWVDDLRDKTAISIIFDRIHRIHIGNLGDHKQLGFGIYEIRMHYGPGYRIYFGRDEDIIIVLLCGGDKRTQKKDIAKAKEYWHDYNQRKIWIRKN